MFVNVRSNFIFSRFRFSGRSSHTHSTVITLITVHIISGDLALHKRTLDPLKSLIYGLRRYDYDRCLALETSSTNDSGESETVPKVVGYMSHKSKIYLADVHDHMEYILSSFDMFGGIAENLINYTFNVCYSVISFYDWYLLT